MKSVLSLFILLSGLNFVVAQERAVVKKIGDITSIKEKGVGSIVLPTTLVNDFVQARAKYYTHYFTIQFDEKTHEATFTMVENTQDARAVIVRFLVACDIQEVTVDGNVMEPSAFFDKYLK